MARIDGMLARLIQTQDEVTHMNEKGRDAAMSTRILIDQRDMIGAEIIAYVTHLENAARVGAGTLRMAALNPHHSDEDRAVYADACVAIRKALGEQ